MKPPVLMIHGAFCGPWSLDGLKEKFESAGYRVTAPALRFHNGARPPAALGTTGLADYAADLEDEMEALGGRPSWWAIPWAGLLAQMLAARRDVAALILLAPSAPWGVPAHHPVRDRRRPGAAPASRLLEHGAGAQPRRGAGPFARQAAAPYARRGVRALCAGIGPRHLRDHELGPGPQPRQRSGCRCM